MKWMRAACVELEDYANEMAEDPSKRWKPERQARLAAEMRQFIADCPIGDAT